MTYVVAFDGSPLAEAALFRAVEYAGLTGERVVAACVIPRDPRYARERGWLSPGEEFDRTDIVRTLHRQTSAVAPEADFRHELVGSSASGAVATEFRRIAAEVDASVVFIGSENAGRLVVPITSVGGKIASDATYDVHIVRHRAPSKVDRLRSKSDFYLPG